MSQEFTLSEKEKIHYTNVWCRSIGIKSKDLTEHPSIDDCIIMINIRNEFWNDMDGIEQRSWAGLWSSIYHKGRSLNKSRIDKLEKIINSALFKRQKQAQRLATIKAFRNRQQANAEEQNGEMI
jgi:hypothetical protein